MRTPLYYVLHSGNLYGTERMALWTASGLQDEFEPVIVAPAGKALEEAERLGFETIPLDGQLRFARGTRAFFSGHRRLAFLATGVPHSLEAAFWNAVYRRSLAHLHLVHGGTDERLSYGRKRWLNHLAVTFVAVSAFVKERLIANGVDAGKIVVIENFLPPSRLASAIRHEAFHRAGVHSAIVVSRVDPIKRVDLLLDALDLAPDLADLPVRVLGTGWDLENLRRRAARQNPNVEFAGYRAEVERELAAADLLVHLCPAEPFGLAILEAMAAGIPVLVPDAGGAGSLVQDGVTGFHFRANDAPDLCSKIRDLRAIPAFRLREVTAAADLSLQTRFSAEARIADYRRLLQREAI